jgi:hypothetical protein
VAAAVNLVLLWLLLVWPGWEALPFLTDQFNQVVGLMSASLLVGAAANLVYVCLLYTSPSPRDRTRSRMPSSA